MPVTRHRPGGNGEHDVEKAPAGDRDAVARGAGGIADERDLGGSTGDRQPVVVDSGSDSGSHVSREQEPVLEPLAEESLRAPLRAIGGSLIWG